LDISELIIRAKRFCEAHKYRFTEPRARILSLLAGSNEPMSPYQVLAVLSQGKETVKPPTVYRAIDFWSRHGFIHKVASINAYIVCCEHKHHGNVCVFICDECHAVLELGETQLPPGIVSDIENNHLTVTESSMEIHGKCSACR